MGNENSQPKDGANQGKSGFKKSYQRARTNSGGSRTLTEEETMIICRRVDDILYDFRARAGTDVVCSQLFSTWLSERDQITNVWNGLTLPARRAMVQNIRENVVWRARSLHRLLLNPGRTTRKDRTRFVRLLMEKICAELFDTSILYDENNLVDLVGGILEHGGGGAELPAVVKGEVFRSFDLEEHMKRARNGTGYVKNSKSDPDLRKLMRRQSSSSYLVDLLSFLPEEMELERRKSLTIKMLTEMRNAVLAHFAVLVFGELIDDIENVVRKYEYGSDSDTDIATSCTEWEDEEEVSSSSEAVSDSDNEVTKQTEKPLLRRGASCSMDETTLSVREEQVNDFQQFTLNPPPSDSSTTQNLNGKVSRSSKLNGKKNDNIKPKKSREARFDGPSADSVLLDTSATKRLSLDASPIPALVT